MFIIQRTNDSVLVTGYVLDYWICNMHTNTYGVFGWGVKYVNFKKKYKHLHKHSLSVDVDRSTSVKNKKKSAVPKYVLTKVPETLDISFFP